MPEDASIFLAEDNKVESQIAKATITRGGHRIVAEASTLAEALAAIPYLPSNTIAVVDANLDASDTSGADGKNIVEALIVHDPKVTIIGYSRDPFPAVPGVNIVLFTKTGSSKGFLQASGANLIDLTKKRKAWLPQVIKEI